MNNENVAKFLEELNKWLEEQKEYNSNRAERCTCFNEVLEEWAYNWRAECYDDTLRKIVELRKKYHLS